MKIGQGFQEIFGIFGKAMGDDFGIVKSTDKRDKVGKHFEKVKQGLEGTKNKLGELSGKIAEAKNANSSTIETVKNAIKGANDVFEQLITSVAKIAGATGNADIGDNTDSGGAVAADPTSVKDIIDGVKTILKTATNSGIKIDEGKGKEGAAVNTGSGSAADMLSGTTAPSAGTAAKLADEVGQADSWAMLDKIKNAETKTDTLGASANNKAGELATGGKV